MTSLLMLDSVELPELRGVSFDACAGYVGGHWPTFAPECSAFPGLAHVGRVVSIAVTAHEDAEILDCEAGDARPEDCVAWIERQLARGVWRPGIYSSLSVWNAGLASTLVHYGPRIRRWVAHYTYRPEIHPGFDAQQWTDRYLGRNLDASQCLESFFPPVAQPAAHNVVRYDWFPDAAYLSPFGRLRERELVLRYDEQRKTAPAGRLLERKLAWLAKRVAYEAIRRHPLPDGAASWGVDHRGWRYQNLVHRSQGRRFT